MNFCLFLALMVRVTSSLGGEMGDEQVIEARSEDIVVAQLDICQNKSKDIVLWQNKSTHLMGEEHQILVKGEKMQHYCSILK